MKRSLSLTLGAALLPFAFCAQSNQFVGRWGFDVPTPNGIGANWLGIAEKGGNLEIWFQPTGGHVFRFEITNLTARA
jgi:hypothetical protein